MELISPSHGKFIYKEEEVINFEKNIPGFDNLKKFILKDIDDGTFKILQCIEDINIGFIVVEPFTIDKNYEINLSDEVINSLNIKSFNDVALYSLVTLNSDPKKATANLRAPIVLNVRNKKAQQFIMDKAYYKIKHPLVKGWYKC